MYLPIAIYVFQFFKWPHFSIVKAVSLLHILRIDKVPRKVILEQRNAVVTYGVITKD